MTTIKDLVSINSQATLVKGVQLAWYNDRQKTEDNNRLAKGYVFGNGKSRKIGNQTEASSITIFEVVRDAFSMSGANNIFTVIARYGHGKSHFALVLANYFGLPTDSPVLEDIIRQIELCSDANTANHFRSFKKHQAKPHLVVTLAGHELQDLRAGFLKALRRALEANPATKDYKIKAVSTEAARWLRTLSADLRRRAEDYLDEHHRMDFDTLVRALDEFDADKEEIAKDLSRALVGGVVDFGAEVSLREVIGKTVDELCTGADAPFSKMLILFDELGVYAERWCYNRMAAGNLAPQQMFEACNDRQSRVCFVGFIQREIGEFVKNTVQQDDFMKWAGRLPQESTYRLVSNLEEVIGRVMLKTEKWSETVRSNAPQISTEAEFAFKSQRRYLETWEQATFERVVARDCFPLHPLTTGLLCNLNFAQGSRSTIEAVKLMLDDDAEQAPTQNGKLNWIAPVRLFDIFENDFKKQSGDYSLYEHAVKRVGNNAEPEIYQILKAIFLFHEGKLKKLPTTEHAEIIARLAGHQRATVDAALLSLKDGYYAIRYNAATREYNFAGMGAGPNDILLQLKRELAGKRVDGLTDALAKLRVFENFKLDGAQASEFKHEFAVDSDEWYLEAQFLDARRLSAENVKKLALAVANKGDARGTVIYLISDDAAELERAADEAQIVLNELRDENFLSPIVVAVPNAPATNLETQILLRQALYEMPMPRQLQYGQSFQEAVKHVERELTEQLIAHLSKSDSVQFVVPSKVQLKSRQKHDLEAVSDELFKDVFGFRPPSNSNLMRPNANLGNTAVAEISKQIILNELNFNNLAAAKQNLVKHVLTDGNNKWGVLDNDFRVREPKNVRVLQAWKEIGNNVHGDRPTTFATIIQKLQQPPFGYDDFTTTFLIAAWIGKHKYELTFIEGKLSIPLNKLQDKLNKAKDFVKWLKTGTVSVKRAENEIKDAAKNYLEKLKTTREVSAAERLIAQETAILSTLPIGNDLRPQILDALQEIKQFVEDSKNVEKTIGDLRRHAAQNNDVTSLLRIVDGLNKLSNGNGNGAQFVKTLNFTEADQFARQRLESVAKQQSQATLARIESYDSVRGMLEKSRAALEKAELSDLAEMFKTALERIDRDYERMQTARDEQPLINEINSISIGNMTLQYYAERQNRLAEILAQSASERVQQTAAARQSKISEQVGAMRNWAANLAARVEAAVESKSLQTLRDEIIRRESFYTDAPEAESLNRALEQLAAKLDELENERRAAAERAQQEREQQREDDRVKTEKDRVRLITNHFAELSDQQQRFDCLLEFIRIGNAAGLTSEQKKMLAIELL